jgi:Ca2+-binding RTX toxin-like protein
MAGLFTKVKASKQVQSVRPQLEGLEDRLTPTVYLSGGDIVIVQTNYSDTASVVATSTGYQVKDNAATYNFSYSQVYGGDVRWYGYAGNDYFYNNTYLRTTAYAGDGNDTVYGGYSNDYLYGQNHTDFLYGRTGNDYVDGGYGTDYVYGQDGNDTLVAGYDYSYNYLDGGNGNDYMYGGYGNDYMLGQAGNDVMYGSYGNDSMYGGTGYDQLFGGYGNDRLDGGNDNVADYLKGEAGADTFIAEWEWSGFWWNRDYPADYSFAQGDTIV